LHQPEGLAQGRRDAGDGSGRRPDPTPEEVSATARHHGVEPAILPGLANMMMLERQGEWAARTLSAWLATLQLEVAALSHGDTLPLNWSEPVFDCEKE